METAPDSMDTMHGLLPANPSFAGHQTFALRSGWLKKGIDALHSTAAGESIFTRDEALVTLGVGKNMVASIRHWLLATSMAQECPNSRGRRLMASPLGMAVFGYLGTDGWDAFLEDEATLWLLHWQLAGPGSLAFTWAWAFNLFREYEFSKDEMVEAVLAGATGRVSRLPARETVERDVECLLHTYVPPRNQGLTDDSLDCPLHGLGLIRPSVGRYYHFDVGPKPMPLPIFAYAMASFWVWRYESALSIPVHDLMHAAGSPGVVFKLDEDSVLEHLDGLAEETEGAIWFDDSPQERNVVRKEGSDLNPLAFLERHYVGH